MPQGPIKSSVETYPISINYEEAVAIGGDSEVALQESLGVIADQQAQACTGVEDCQLQLHATRTVGGYAISSSCRVCYEPTRPRTAVAAVESTIANNMKRFPDVLPPSGSPTIGFEQFVVTKQPENDDQQEIHLLPWEALYALNPGPPATITKTMHGLLRASKSGITGSVDRDAILVDTDLQRSLGSRGYAFIVAEKAGPLLEQADEIQNNIRNFGESGVALTKSLLAKLIELGYYTPESEQ